MHILIYFFSELLKLIFDKLLFHLRESKSNNGFQPLLAFECFSMCGFKCVWIPSINSP